MNLFRVNNKPIGDDDGWQEEEWGHGYELSLVACHRSRGSRVGFIVGELFKKDLWGENRGEKVRVKSGVRMRSQVKSRLEPGVGDGDCSA